MTALGAAGQRGRDAARLALQSAVAAAATFVLMQVMGLPEKFVAVLSAVLVVQPSAGSTLGRASDRVLATVVGCLIGVTCLYLLPSGYGTAAALALAMFVMNAIAGFWPEWRYGVVAAVALSLGADENIFETAILRTVGIGLGSLVGALTAYCVWPDRGSYRAREHLDVAMRSVAKLIDSAVDQSQTADNAAADAFHKRIADAREALRGVRFGDTDTIRFQVDKVDRLYNSALIVKRIADETDTLRHGDENFVKSIDGLHEQYCKALMALADSGSRQLDESLLTTLTRDLEALEAKLERTPESAGHEVEQTVLLFGFRQMLEQIRAISHGVDLDRGLL